MARGEGGNTDAESGNKIGGDTHMTSALGGGVPQKQTKADEGGQADLDVIFRDD